MSENLLYSLAAIIILGISAQWISWKFRLPSILLLLVFGFLAGPVAGIIDTNRMFGDILLPFVSLAVAIILFEGGLSLKFSEFSNIGKPVKGLLTIGVAITWTACSISAHYILGLNWKIAWLFGAILVVSGPTVIYPLLRHVRPSKKIGSILRWEGILIDPVGALLAVLVFEAIFIDKIQEATAAAIWGFAKTILLGSGTGYLAAQLMIALFKRFLVPDFLEEVFTLMMVIAAFVLSNILQHESGLLTVTVMGMTLANQKVIPVSGIIEFKENLRTLLIAILFILLSARLTFQDFSYISIELLIFIIVLLFLARPLSVILSTLRSGLSWKEKAFLSWVAPRGIVAAAVSSLFALRLSQKGVPQAEYLVPLTFIVIIATVAIYGLSASPLARGLGVARPDLQGSIFIGAHSWAREIAKALESEGFPVLLVDTNRSNISHARMEGLTVYYGNILSEYSLDKIESKIEVCSCSRILGLTSNDEVNSLAVMHFADVFGTTETYQLPPYIEKNLATEKRPRHLRGRLLFNKNANFFTIRERFQEGAVVKKVKITGEFTFDDFISMYGPDTVILFIVNESGALNTVTADKTPQPSPGDMIICIVKNRPD